MSDSENLTLEGVVNMMIERQPKAALPPAVLSNVIAPELQRIADYISRSGANCEVFPNGGDPPCTLTIRYPAHGDFSWTFALEGNTIVRVAGLGVSAQETKSKVTTEWVRKHVLIGIKASLDRAYGKRNG